jgi:hypothetical protein
VTAAAVAGWLDVSVVPAVPVLVAPAVVAAAVPVLVAPAVPVVVVAEIGAVEATLVTEVVDGVAATAPIDPVCQIAPNATAKVARRVAATRRRIIEIRRARISSRARAVVGGVSSGCMPGMLMSAHEGSMRGPWEIPQSRGSGPAGPGGGGPPPSGAAGQQTSMPAWKSPLEADAGSAARLPAA